MPVAPQIGCIQWHDYQMPGPLGDHLVTTRTEIFFRGLVRLNASDFELRIVGELHRLAEQHPCKRQSSDDEGAHDDDDIERGFFGLVLGIETHHMSIAAEVLQR
ncbi:MAG: hypothetical protein ACC652_00055 [Acidimicrobiales bacterium]